MPSRTITLAIIVFWLAMTFWLIRRDVWPHIAPGEPPAFALDLMDKSKPDSLQPGWDAVRWTDGEEEPERYTIKTETAYDETSAIVKLKAVLTPKRSSPERLRVFQLGKLESEYQVGMDWGQMLGFKATVKFSPGVIGTVGARKGTYIGTVKDRVCTLDWTITHRPTEGPGATGFEPSTRTERVTVSHSGVVLLPLHPVARMQGLTPGRRWSMWLIDPLANAALLSGPLTTRVHAEVLAGVQLLPSGDERECRIVEYEGEDVSGRFWVDLGGQVRRMDFRRGSVRWEITLTHSR